MEISKIVGELTGASQGRGNEAKVKEEWGIIEQECLSQMEERMAA